MKESVKRTENVITVQFKSFSDRVLASRREKVKGLGIAGLDNKALTKQKKHHRTKKGVRFPGSPRSIEVTELERND